MTKRNPYAPKTDHEIAVRDAQKTPLDVVPGGTVKEILAWVGDDLDRARLALDKEKAGNGRTTLIDQLESLLDG